MALTDVNIFYDNLVKIKDIVDFEKYCLNEKELIRNSYNTSMSIKTTFTKYRNKSKELKIKKEKIAIIYNVFVLDVKENDKIRLEYSKKVSNDLSDLKWIYSVDDYIKVSIDLIKSIKITDNIIGLAGLTGRRVAEIGCLASFKYENVDKVWFKGQLKTRDRWEVKPYLIPVLYNSNEIINVLNKVRYNLTKFNNDTVLFHDTYSKTLSSTTKKYYSEIFEDVVTPKDLRSAYATIVNDKFNNGSKAVTRYIAQILGHGETDNNTCNSYMKYRIN